MEMMASNTQISVITHRGDNIKPGEIIDERQTFYRPTVGAAPAKDKRKSSARIDWVKYVPPVENAGSFRILLVGNEQIGQGIRITLSPHLNFAIEYREAGSGKLALQTLESQVIDLIIFGGDIADMDGLEFLDRLNRQYGKNKIPVIEILNSEAAKTGVQAMKMGAHDYLLKDADGHYFELLPILVSRIYEERQTMSALRKTMGVHQAVADSTPSVIYQLSLQGGRHDVCISPEISAMGISAESWGNDAELHHQMCHEEDRQIVREALEHSYQTGSPFKCEYRIKTFSNTLHWVVDKARVVMDKHGRPLFLQGVMTDITSLKTLETELAHYRTMIDKIVRERTERMDRRVSILESCNSTLGENYHKMHRMYLDLLTKTQALESGIGGCGAATGV